MVTEVCIMIIQSSYGMLFELIPNYITITEVCIVIIPWPYGLLFEFQTILRS